MVEHGEVRLLMIADTHLPRRARALPDAVWREVERADVVVHAGDWTEPGLLDGLSARSRRLVGVFGNNDGEELRARLPEAAHVVLDGVRLAVVHETGAATGRGARVRAAFPGADVLVFGHSHVPWDVEHEGLRAINPGSPTDRRRQPWCTYATAQIVGGVLGEVVLHRLPRRTG